MTYSFNVLKAELVPISITEEPGDQTNKRKTNSSFLKKTKTETKSPLLQKQTYAGSHSAGKKKNRSIIENILYTIRTRRNKTKMETEYGIIPKKIQSGQPRVRYEVNEDRMCLYKSVSNPSRAKESEER